jgi:peroxiredoxin
MSLLVLASSAAASGLAGEAKVKAPSFRSKDLQGEAVVLDDLLGHGPILVDFWATWCKPCLKELPYVQRISQEYSERGLQVLAVTIDSPKTQSRVRPFIKSKKYDFRVVMDASQDVFRKLQGKGTVPYVVVLDREGYIRYRHTGYRHGDEKELEKVVVQLLEEGEAAAAEKAEVEGAG